MTVRELQFDEVIPITFGDNDTNYFLYKVEFTVKVDDETMETEATKVFIDKEEDFIECCKKQLLSAFREEFNPSKDTLEDALEEARQLQESDHEDPFND